jgi:FkbM family methyltransferase
LEDKSYKIVTRIDKNVVFVVFLIIWFGVQNYSTLLVSNAITHDKNAINVSSKKKNFLQRRTKDILNDIMFSYTIAKCQTCQDQTISWPRSTTGICERAKNIPKQNCCVELESVHQEYKIFPDLKKPFWTRVYDENGNCSIHINTHDPKNEDIYISAQIHDKGTWDEYILSVFHHVLQKVPREKRAAQLVVDVGANIGFFSLTAASYGVRTISFEPMRFNLDRLVSSIERNRGFGRRMEVYNMAVSNSNQMVFLKPTSAETNAGNFFIQDVPAKDIVGQYGVDYVTSVTLDQIINQDVLLMKIDVETYEPFVLDGAFHLLCHNIVRHIIIEVDKNQDSAHGGVCPSARMLTWMDELGYDVTDVVVGAPKIDVKKIEVKKLPPNIWFSLRDHSVPPVERLGIRSEVCQ